jgi:hypothetical protein
MKTLLIAAGLSLLTTSAFAATKLKACSASDLVDLKTTIKEWSAEGLTESKYMANAEGKILGFYAWNVAGDEIYAEVCEYLSTDELTVASNWYYWEAEGSADPTTWKKGEAKMLAQDEGIVTLTVSKPSAKGDISAVLEILGEEDDVLKRDTIKFVTTR